MDNKSLNKAQGNEHIITYNYAHLHPHAKKTRSHFIQDLAKKVNRAYNQRNLSALEQLGEFILELELNAKMERIPREINELLRLKIIVDRNIEHLGIYLSRSLLTHFLSYLKHQKVQEETIQ